MSQGLTNTKRRINSITGTRKITKAMELVATVKLKRWKDSMDHITRYLSTMTEIISSCASNNEVSDALELTHFKNAESTLYIVVTSSLGLCGGYNYNLFKFLNNKIKKEDKVLVIGTKGFTKLHHEVKDIDDNYVNFLDKLDYQKVNNLKSTILKEYSSGKYKAVKLISTIYRNSLIFDPTEFTLLPLENLSKNELTKETIYEPNKEEVLNLLLPKYLSTFLYGRLTEALVCEQASRRNAMDSANDNADELLEKLHIEYNKARQAAITQEITEVIAGSN